MPWLGATSLEVPFLTAGLALNTGFCLFMFKTSPHTLLGF